jgi:diguanylate cyclase (GGDEF)-like protein
VVNHPELIEQLGPQARLQEELSKLGSHGREDWAVLGFIAAVLLLGALSLLFPTSFWHLNALELKIPPQVLFLVMMLLMVGVLYFVRSEAEMRRLRLLNLQQLLATQAEQSASMIDPGTHVLNRTFLRDLLKGEIVRAERNKRPLALIMCDLNNFKQVNDRYGHLMGDYVLAQVAAILKSCVRGSDYVVRYGGDEFLLVLPETDQGGGEIVRGRILQRVGEWDRANRVGDVPISLSLGLSFHATGQTAEQDIAEADTRMYADKQMTQTRTAVAGGSSGGHA